jgi:aminoglycoside phosphotransferase (APT) family kinase protein
MNDRRAADDASASSDALARWLADAAGAKSVRIVGYARLGGGAIQDNFALEVDVDGGPWHGAHRWVLRTNPSSSVSASASRADEYEWLRVAHDAGVLAPRPLFLCRDPSVLGREFFVMERLPGVAAGHRLTRDASLVPDADALVFALGANLARIHSIRPSTPRPSPAGGRGRTPTSSAPPSDNPALVTIATYREWLDCLDDAYPALEWGLRWCERNAPSEYDVTLVHRDYRTGNYLVDDGKLVGVLDWEFAGWGDPREDIGWFTARCWRFAAREREAGGMAAVEPFLAGYRSVSSRSISRADLDYWQAMAHIRWAIIALEQARRHRREPSLELALTGRIVDELELEVLHLTGSQAT